MTQLSIIMPVFNKINFTISILKDLFRLTTDTEILCIDNASTDNTKDELSKIDKKNFIYIKNDINLMHSKACNIGFSHSSGKYVMFINNDVKIKENHENWTDNIIKYCDNNIVGPSMGLLDNNFNFIKESSEELVGNTYLAGWCIASSRENWKKLLIDGNQIFDEKLPFYFNDTDLGFRCRKINMPMKIVDVPAVHFKKISASQLNIPELYKSGKEVFSKKWSQ